MSPTVSLSPIAMLQYINKINLLFSHFNPIYPNIPTPFFSKRQNMENFIPNWKREGRQEKEKAEDKTIDEDQEENLDN